MSKVKFLTLNGIHRKFPNNRFGTEIQKQGTLLSKRFEISAKRTEKPALTCFTSLVLHWIKNSMVVSKDNTDLRRKTNDNASLLFPTYLVITAVFPPAQHEMFLTTKQKQSFPSVFHKSWQFSSCFSCDFLSKRSRVTGLCLLLIPTNQYSLQDFQPIGKRKFCVNNS